MEVQPTLNKPPENYDLLIQSGKGLKPLQYDEATNKVTTRSQAKKDEEKQQEKQKKDEENPIFAEIKKGTILKKAVTQTKEDKKNEKLKSNPMFGKNTYDDFIDNPIDDDDIPPINSIPVIKKVSKIKKSSQNPVIETNPDKDVGLLSSFSSMMNMIPNIKPKKGGITFEGDNDQSDWA